MKKKYIYLIIFIGLISICNPVLADGFSNDSVYSACGIDTLPEKLPSFTSGLYNLIKIIVPIILVITGMVDFFKAMSSNSEDEMKKSQRKFGTRLIAAVIVFLVMAVVQLVFNQLDSVKNDSGFFSCMDCILSNKCGSSSEYSNGYGNLPRDAKYKACDESCDYLRSNTKTEHAVSSCITTCVESISTKLNNGTCKCSETDQACLKTCSNISNNNSVSTDTVTYQDIINSYCTKKANNTLNDTNARASFRNTCINSITKKVENGSCEALKNYAPTSTNPNYINNQDFKVAEACYNS